MASYGMKIAIIAAALASSMAMTPVKDLGEYDEDMQEAISASANRINLMMNNYILKGVYMVVEATRQMQGNGMAYHLALVLRDTNCVKRGEHWNLNNCQILDNPPTLDVSCTTDLSTCESGNLRVTSVECGSTVRWKYTPKNSDHQKATALHKFISSLKGIKSEQN